MQDPAPRSPTPEDTVYAWWTELTRPDEHGRPSRRGELAELRRCKTLEEVFFAPVFHSLYHRMAPSGWRYRQGLAAVAGVLVHVRNEPEQDRRLPFASYLASKPKGRDSSLVSEQRFRRLVACKTHPELFSPLLRIVHLASDQVPVKDLARGIYYWNDKTRRDWTFDYYNQLLEQEPNH
jgi:CRISPR system Cascade subunit CasB